MGECDVDRALIFLCIHLLALTGYGLSTNPRPPRRLQPCTMEQGTTDQVITNPRHPCSRVLLRCLLKISVRQEKLLPIPGLVPDLAELPIGCPFAPRCDEALPECSQEGAIPLKVLPDGRSVRWLSAPPRWRHGVRLSSLGLCVAACHNVGNRGRPIQALLKRFPSIAVEKDGKRRFGDPRKPIGRCPGCSSSDPMRGYSLPTRPA
jgi:oligopeptide/dipeptide ABC transporter ATP-binding protein